MEELIRSILGANLARNPWTAEFTGIGGTEERNLLGAAGGIESYQTARQTACYCGCLKPPGGFCSVCSQVICVDHFVHCQECARPLWIRYTQRSQDDAGREIRLCRRCYDRARRERIRNWFLSPFVEFKRQ
jgi:hypothetical protein